MKSILPIGLSVVLALGVVGCKEPIATSVDQNTKVAAIPAKHVSAAPSFQSNKLKVIGANGKSLSLDVKDGPILLFAYWCPHCSKALAQMQNDHILHIRAVSVGDVADLSKLVQKTANDFSRLGVKYPVYYMNTPSGKMTYPTILVWKSGQVQKLEGEPNGPDRWKELLDGK